VIYRTAHKGVNDVRDNRIWVSELKSFSMNSGCKLEISVQGIISKQIFLTIPLLMSRIMTEMTFRCYFRSEGQSEDYIGFNTRVCIYVCMYVHIYVGHICIFIYMCIYTYACVYIQDCLRKLEYCDSSLFSVMQLKNIKRIKGLQYFCWFVINPECMTFLFF